jgi:type VII secretion ATPase EccA
MADQLVNLFATAAGMRTTAPSRARDLFGEITAYDESICDAWIGRISCGDLERTTLFRAWYSRRNFGRLAGAAEVPINALEARVPIGGGFGDITYPVTSPFALTMGFAVAEAGIGNFTDAMEAIDEASGGAPHYLVSWVKAVIYSAAHRWTDVIAEIKDAESWPDPFLASAGKVAHGVAAANLGLFNEAERRLTEANSSPAGRACAAAIAWYLAMTRRALGNEAGAVALLEWLQASFASPKAAEALKNPGYRLVTTTAESIESRADAWDPSSVMADDTARDALLMDAQAELDRQIGLTRVKEQVDRYRAATQMAKVRGARGMKVGQSSRHMIFTGPPGTGKTTIARIVANILAGLGVITEPKLIETSRKDFVAEYEGQSAVKTTKTIDRALGGVLFIDEAYTLVQERDGRADPFGTEALDTLLARMENDRDQLVVIIAGYSNDIDRLLEVNDGLRSRFSNRIEFESYSPEEIAQIAEVIAARNDSLLDNDAVQQVVKAATLLSGQRLNGKPALDIAGNGRYARQLVETAEECRDLRLSRSANLEQLATDELSMVTGEDMVAAVAGVHTRLGVGA